jgi:hypothetical protein
VTPHVVSAAVEAAGEVRDAAHLRRFKHAVDDFVSVLSTAPDEKAGALSSRNVRTLQQVGEDVIDLIEERVPDVGSAADAQELVSDVYEIRRLLEETARWRQHYLTERTS